MNICVSSAVKCNVYIFLFLGSNISTPCVSLSDAILHCNCLESRSSCNFNMAIIYNVIKGTRFCRSCVAIAKQFFSTASTGNVYRNTSIGYSTPDLLSV